MYTEDALAAENVLGLFRQQVPHEHVEAVFIQRPPCHHADGADVAQVMQFLAFPLRVPLFLWNERGGGGT